MKILAGQSGQNELTTLAEPTEVKSASRIGSPVFIVPHTWPDIKNAEFEVVQRLAAAAGNIGAVMIVITNDGYPLWSSDDRPLDRNKLIDLKTVDFMISLHFESPRLLDIHSYYALWQPIDFYRMFGYARTSEQVLSHIDALSCSSEIADAHAVNLFRGARVTTSTDFPLLFHSPPEPYYPSKISATSRLFYVGINWERINSDRGRHQDLLEKLDEEGLIDIYGPRSFLGVEPWRGFKCYRGELAFDGKSVVRAVQNAGICLALSSESHQRSALMSNRLFEGLAAGAAIICNRNGFIDKYFGDLVYAIDDRLVGDELFFQVKDIVADIRADPQIAIARAVEGQTRLSKMFSLEGCLSNIASGHAARRALHERDFMSFASVTVVLVYVGDSISELLDCLTDILDQKHITLSVVIICDEGLAKIHSDEMRAAAAGRTDDLKLMTGRYSRSRLAAKTRTSIDLSGARVGEALSGVCTEFFTVMHVGERWFRDHLATVARAIEASPTYSFGIAGAIDEHQSSANTTIRTTRTLDRVRPNASTSDIVNGKFSGDCGRFLYRREVLKAVPLSCMRLLDGEEAYLLQATAAMAGELAISGFATFVRVAIRESIRTIPEISIVEQRQFITDALSCHPKWTMFHDVSKTDDSKAVKTEAGKSGGSIKVPIGQLQHVREGEAILHCIGSGFSYPEKYFVWIDGVSGELFLEIEDSPNRDFETFDLVLTLAGRPDSTGRQQHCTISVNGKAVSYVMVPEAEAEFSVRLADGNATSRTLQVHLVADHAEQVRDANGIVIDTRRLGLRLYSIEIVPIIANAAEIIVPMNANAADIEVDIPRLRRAKEKLLNRLARSIGWVR